MDYQSRLKKFAVDLFKIDGIKFGEYKTKVGLMTPVYCDLRVLISYPKLLDFLANLIADNLPNLKSHDSLCGVPYTALPIATVVSVKTGIPMVMRRQEKKYHGTKKLIEGHFNTGDKCLIVEDVVTSGSSILETVKDLREAGLECSETIVLLNREQGGENLLKKSGIKMHALLTLTTLISFLKEEGCVDDVTVTKVQEYIKSNQVEDKEIQSRLKLQYTDRIPFTKNPVAKRLLKIISEKQSNLCLAADVLTGTELLNLAEEVGPYICILKTHIDIIEDFNENLTKHLKDISQRHNFLLLEDRKFADIGKVVQLQYTKGVFKISSWAKLITQHAIIGPGALQAVKQNSEDLGVFLLTEISTKDNLISSSYTKAALEMAEGFSHLITGIVCQSPLFLDKPGFLQLTPGVKLNSIGDSLGQQYSSPENVILERGADIAVVGRGITEATDRAQAAEKYRNLLWEAYQKRVEM
ncbi:uridine 5'-monophosphate synthase [Agrilus planipennis]|uniref:Uridine 5'-monophosphate synthase n=1 Tax=Agrilus planipennis TaxID=224129 RepID=A0A1W4WG07_AGRPL|nr:uridine 5'-monophosphate synthase [Agrilus planipennis]